MKMWSLAFYDLPVGSKEQRRKHTRWRNNLLREGFHRMQFSVYGKHFQNAASSKACLRRLRQSLPSAGEVRFLTVTERQMEKMLVYQGQKQSDPELVPEQLLLL